MVSTETLRRFPFFSQMSAKQLIQVAMTSQLLELENSEVIFEESQPAAELFFLLSGCVDIFYTVQDDFHPQNRKQVPVCQVNPGEPFGISALIEPRVLTSSARSCGASRVISFDRVQLESAFEADPALETLFLHRVASAAIERLHSTRIMLAAAYS